MAMDAAVGKMSKHERRILAKRIKSQKTLFRHENIVCCDSQTEVIFSSVFAMLFTALVSPSLYPVTSYISSGLGYLIEQSMLSRIAGPGSGVKRCVAPTCEFK